MNNQINTVIRNIILQKLGDGDDFTALEITNYIRNMYFMVRYKEVAETIREMFEVGSIQSHGYDRSLIEIDFKDGNVIKIFRYFRSEIAHSISIHPFIDKDNFTTCNLLEPRSLSIVDTCVSSRLVCQ